MCICGALVCKRQSILCRLLASTPFRFNIRMPERHRAPSLPKFQFIDNRTLHMYTIFYPIPAVQDLPSGEGAKLNMVSFAFFAATKVVTMSSAWSAALTIRIATSSTSKSWRHPTFRTSREIREELNLYPFQRLRFS